MPNYKYYPSTHRRKTGKDYTLHEKELKDITGQIQHIKREERREAGISSEE